MRFSVLFGAFLLLMGLSILLNVFFAIDLPLGKIFMGLVFVWVGANMLSSAFGVRLPGRDGFFESSNVAVGGEGTNEANIIFSQGKVNLAGARLGPGVNRFEVNALFGEAVVLFDPNVPMEVSSSAVFGRADLPDGNHVFFGDADWRSGPIGDGPSISLKAAAVFGSVRFVPVDGARDRVEDIRPLRPLRPEALGGMGFVKREREG